MINGAILIGSREAQASERFIAYEAASGVALAGDFSEADAGHVAEAGALAEAAFGAFSETTLEVRADFLDACAQAILDIGDELIERTMAETGLPRARLEGERGRTVGQLRLFAEVVRRGDWLDVAIDPALPERAPLPRPDLRRRNVAVGPVAVFGASNFPLAFSVAGGDTASALAAGCPVIVKGHPAHPGAGELVARAIAGAVQGCGLPAGTFSYLPGTSHQLGEALVSDPRVKSVGFTGSRRGGLALEAVARARPEPIPVFAEMSSVNPVILFPAALEARAEAMATAFVQSLTTGAGQLCTNPGLVLAIESPGLDRFIAAAAGALAQSPGAVMLTAAMRRSYVEGAAALAGSAAVKALAYAPQDGPLASPALFATSAKAFAADKALAAEVFGASSLLVRCTGAEDLARAIAGLEGQLTVTLQIDEADHDLAAGLLPALERKAGRLLANGWPTGVEVSHAMVHGGPFPATTDARTTSVGPLAIARFLRPVCYQNFPDDLWPAPLRLENPLGVARRIDGILTPASSSQ